MQTSFVIFFIVIGLIFGVWNRFKEFYPTLLFWIIGNLIYDILLYHHRVWEFIPVGIDDIFLPNHLIISLAISFAIYPFVIVVYLGRFPSKSIFTKISWVTLWALVFQIIETIAYYNKSISHHHGWSLIWSFMFNMTTYTILVIHQWKPWVAWSLSVIKITILFIIFDPPFPK